VIAAWLCLAALLVAVCRRASGKKAPLDRDEIRILRRLSDRIRSEQALPFD
jgi:hypothetical protein